MAKDTDTYIHQKVQKVIYKGKEVNKTPRGSKNKKVAIQLKVNDKVIGNGKDNVYVFTDKTYYKKKYSL